jgi:DNA-directed RNA polymerase
MKVKVGAFLTNLMCKNLKFKVGNHEYMLLKPQVVKNTSGPVGSGSQKFIGFVSFNKGFIEDFIGELDKIHDLNLQMDRSVPMIYPPAPWKNFFFGGYYLKQTKMAKVLPQFMEAVKYLNRTNMEPMCQTLDILGSVKWKLNMKILEMMEYIWSIGGGLAGIPKRYNDRTITPELFREAPFREKLKLLQEHQRNKESHCLRCEWLLRLGIA